MNGKNNKQIRLFRFDDFKIFEIIENDENPPVFYNPTNVVKLVKWLYGLSNVAIVYIVISGIPKIVDSKSMVDYFLESYPMIDSLTWFIIIPIVIFGLVLQFFLYFFGLRGMANVLGILMEMEFKSRD